MFSPLTTSPTSPLRAVATLLFSGIATVVVIATVVLG